jgi:hypothetical protein
MLLGVSSAEAMAMLQSHSMQVYMPGLVIDMNPRKTEPMKEKAPSKEETTSADKVKKHEINSEDLETFCHFVHGSSLTSKDKVVEEFRLANPKVICSRAELQRKLDVMSNKHKCLDGGALWEVRKEALATFGLTIQLKEIQIPQIPLVSDVAATKPLVTAGDQAATVEGANAPAQPAAQKAVKKRKKKRIALTAVSRPTEKDTCNDATVSGPAPAQPSEPKAKKKRITPTAVSRPTQKDTCNATVPAPAPAQPSEPKANPTPPKAPSPEPKPKKRKAVHASASLFTAFFKKKLSAPTEKN